LRDRIGPVRWSRRSALSAEENALHVALGEAHEAGRSVLDLTASNPTVAGLPYDEEAILSPLGDPAALRYAPDPRGSLEARASLTQHFGVDEARVMLTASTSEAYAMLLTVLTDPGDRVLAPEPSYPLLSHLAQFGGVALTPYALRWDGRWHVDATSVREAALTGARAVLAVSPNNPTGSYLDEDDLAALDATGLPVVVDEVFGRYPLEAAATTAYSLSAPRIVVGGLSKLAGLPQMKIGWILVGGDDAFAEALLSRLEVVADAFLSVSTPSQLSLPRWLDRRGPVVEAIRARTRKNLTHLRALVGDDSPISVPRVEGGWYACLRVPRTRTDEAWALHLLERDHVLVQPGYFYDFADDGWLVVSLLTEEPTFTEGIARLVARVERDE
jgi:hypothetical protein